MHDTFRVPCVLIGFGLPDENAHAPDEHIALENYYGGIKAIAHFYEDLANLYSDGADASGKMSARSMRKS
jgi:acetylornithine deacetylase/succinyl-diaminopimelate desuccinylase-like protein